MAGWPIDPLASWLVRCAPVVRIRRHAPTVARTDSTNPTVVKELCDHALAGGDDVISDDIDCGIYGGGDDDHGTLITRVRRSSKAGVDSRVLIYGTKSRWVFGMSVRTRCKLFNVPYPAEVTQGSGATTTTTTTTTRRDVTVLRYLPGGRLLVVYERHGLAVLDFGGTAVQS